MGRENSQKIKLLELLHLETDENHPMLASAVCARLSDIGISCDRRTLIKDVEALNEFGYEVMEQMVGHEKAYYVEDRSFSIPEIKILLDAVQAARFVTPQKTSGLTAKIASLGGSHRAEILKSNMVCFNTQKHTNEAVFYTVCSLEQALETRKKVSFRYFDLNEKREKTFRRDGQHYIVEPIALVFNEDNYYLLTYSAKHEGIVSYRVDRMASVTVAEESVCEALTLRKSAETYSEQAFKMYGGQPVTIKIQFTDNLIGPVYDKFGESIKIVRMNESCCTATVPVQISPTFWGWIFQSGGQMKILEPERIVAEQKRQIRLLMKQLEI